MRGDNEMDQRILARGKDFLSSIKGESPSIFNKSWWTGKVMDWCMKNENFKVRMFRFVDVLPYLENSENLMRHLREYFGEDEEVPTVLRWGVKSSGSGKGLASKVLAKTVRGNIVKMARQFIIGENTRDAVKNIAKLRKNNFAVVVDLLGEATVSEAEAEEYLKGYLELLDALAGEQDKWKPLGSGKELDWDCEPKINVAVKPSAFYSQASPKDVEGSVRAIYERVRQVYKRVRELGGFLCIDMEQRAYKDITIELFKRLRTAPEFKDYPHLGIVLQSYLKETDQDLEDLLLWARTTVGLPISIRLVKGAYWDYETVLARQEGLEIPVHTCKAETDAAFERQAIKILENHDICRLACGSHNIRSISTVLENAKRMNVPEQRYEFQVLYGMAEPVRKGLLNVAGRVRLYCPYGELLPGMAYLVRRLLENTANESFLRQSFDQNLDVETLLANPEHVAAQERVHREDRHKARDKARNESQGLPPFVNEPMADFTRESVKQEFVKAIKSARKNLGKAYPLFIGGQEVTTEEMAVSVNPANPDEVAGKVSQAGVPEVDMAIQAAKDAFPAWKDTDPGERAQCLLRAAAIARRDIYDLSAIQVLEVGKQWDQAYADVAEAIDFMEYYARDMIRLGAPRRMGRAPGEMNQYFYEPMGITAVIGPWNFPMAIPCGMTSAAMVTGNCVLFKSSNLSPVMGHALTRVYREAGIPDGVYNFIPGKSSVMGDYLVEHPDISVIAFTGSMEVGLHIQEKAAKVRHGQPFCKRVVCEMGGKNAIIVDDDADLDEAVHHIVYSAFGFQGQKCSACSRVIVLDDIYEKFRARLVEAANSLKIGPAEDPANYVGPVVDQGAQEKIREYVDLCAKEGQVLVKRKVPERGYYVPLTVVEGITKEDRLAQEEIFGPVLAVMRAGSYDEALDIANSTRFALTGGVFSRSPVNLEKARKEFRVGNLYLNRGSTGALVERQPFGGFKMSGVGSKTGGPDYLLQYMIPRVVTENTMRRGFAPVEEDDDWIE